jgi:LAS superfamily LD-carboxypeptidase LdcB
MLLPVVPVKLPPDLRGVTNGELPRKLLKPIQPSGRLHHWAAESWEMLRLKALEEKLVLAQVGDYRPLDQQIALFKTRMRTFPDAKRQTQTTRRWNGEVWYLHTGAPVATPGTSNHGLGLAIDAALRLKNGSVVSITHKPKAAKRSGLEFLAEWAPRFGWSWEIPKVEPWHIRYVTGRPPKVIE